MPDYDEYDISYKDRSVLSNASAKSPPGASGCEHLLVLDGVISGTWKRVAKDKTLDIETTLFVPLNKVQQQAIENAVKRYCLFMPGSAENHWAFMRGVET